MITVIKQRMKWVVGLCALGVCLGAAEAPPVKLVNFDHYAEGGETHIIVGAAGPFFYTIYRPTPDTLTLEIPGMDASEYAEKAAKIKTAAVKSLIVTLQKSGAPDVKTTMTLALAPGTTHSHWMQGTNLYLDLSVDPAVKMEVAEGVSAAPTTQKAEGISSPKEVSPLPPPALSGEDVEEAAPPTKEAAVKATVSPARVLKAVEASKGKIVLTGDGSLNWETFTLSNPRRIVVDVVGVSNGVGRKTFEKGLPEGMERVRVSQFTMTPEKVTRVVFDMKEDAAYSVAPNGNRLEVTLEKKTPTAEAPKAAPVVQAAEQSGGETAAPRQAAVAPLPVPASGEIQAAEAVKPSVAPRKEEAPKKVLAAVAPPPQTADALPRFKVAREPVTKVEAAAMERPEWLNESVAKFESADTSTLETRGGTLESTTIGGETKYKGETIIFDLKDADIKDIFRVFASMSGLNFVLDKSVGGTITLVLRDVPWDQALDIILKNEGWGKVYQNNVVFIAPLERLAREEGERRKLKEAQEVAEDPVTKVFKLSYTKSADVMALIKQGKLLTKQGEVFDDKRSNFLFVRDVVGRFETIEQLIKAVDKSMPQVEIEARIVETTKDYARALGIQWGAKARADQAHGTTTRLQFPHRIGADYAVNLPAGGAFSFLDLSMGNVIDSFALNVSLSMMERTGRGKVLSSPRVVTLNNQKANIQSGVQIPYIVTTDLQVTVNFIPAMIQMDVTPQITNEETVIMDISVNKSEPGPVVSGSGISVPSIITRQAKTQVLVKDGGTAVIGGVFQVAENMSEQRVPGLSKIPGLGWLFRSRNKDSRNDELLIFITPRIQKIQF